MLKYIAISRYLRQAHQKQIQEQKSQGKSPQAHGVHSAASGGGSTQSAHHGA